MTSTIEIVKMKFGELGSLILSFGLESNGRQGDVMGFLSRFVLRIMNEREGGAAYMDGKTAEWGRLTAQWN